MKTKKRTAVGVVEEQVRAMTFPFMSVADEENEERSTVSHRKFSLFETIREKEMKGIIDAAARSVASMDISDNDIYTDPKNVYTSKEVKQFHDLLRENDSCLHDSSDGGMWDVSCGGGMKKIPSCYGH